MKTYARMAVALLVCALSICPGCSQEPDYQRYGSRISSSFSDPVKLREIFEEISRDLRKSPADRRLLLLRLQLSGILQDVSAYESDTYTLAEMFPKEPGYQFQKCLIMERRSGLTDSVRKCYGDILPLYESMMEPGAYKHHWDYVVTALMAGSAGAEALREQFIRDAGDDPSVWHDKRFLQYFDRRMLVTGSIPPELFDNPPPAPARSIPFAD